MIAELLDISHREQVFDLLRNREKFSTQENKDQILEHLLHRTECALIDRKKDRVLGAFGEHGLEAILAQTFSNKIPIWVMQAYATKFNRISLSRGYGAALEACFLKAMTDAESMGIYDFWWSVPEKYARNGPRMHVISPSWSRYEVYTDLVVPANEFPKYELHTHAYGQLVKPHPVYIRHAVCRQEFRQVPLTR